MRPLSLLPASLLVLAASIGAQTQPQTYPLPDTAPISTVEVTAPAAKTVRLRDDQVRQVAGIYEMSNGWRLAVKGAPRYIDATIDNEKPIRLRALSADKFVSGDGNVIMEFNRGSMREDMKMSYATDPRSKKMVEVEAQRAKR